MTDECQLLIFSSELEHQLVWFWPGLALLWTSSGSPRTSSGPPLDLLWISSGHPLDLLNSSFGPPPLDLLRIPKDLLWTSSGPPQAVRSGASLVEAILDHLLGRSWLHIKTPPPPPLRSEEGGCWETVRGVQVFIHHQV